MSKVIHGYTMNDEFTTKKSGFSRWGFARRDGSEFFIKEFISPVYPSDDAGMSPAQVKIKRDECDKFEAEKRKLYYAVNKCSTGNIVTISDFFREGTRYYITTEKIDTCSLALEDVCGLSEDKLTMLSRIILYNFDKLHLNHIVHADVKPDNLLLKVTPWEYITAKVIDFDSSFFENGIIPAGDEIESDQVYCAPETCLRVNGEDVGLSCKIDIFALGIVLHQYWSGTLPVIPDEYDYIYEAVLNGVTPELNLNIPRKIRSMIERMLCVDPDKRPSAAQLLSWLISKKDIPKEDASETATAGIGREDAVPAKTASEESKEKVISEETAKAEETVKTEEKPKEKPKLKITMNKRSVDNNEFFASPDDFL